MHSRFVLLRTTLILLILSVASLPAFAQKAKSKAPGKPPGKTRSQTISQTATPAASKPKDGKAESCDGALEIVPRKQVSFVRKRRPANTPSVPTLPADAKPEKRSGEIIKTNSGS
jgi:hypothetical protein